MTLVTAHFVTSHRGCGGEGGRETMNFILHTPHVNTCGSGLWGGRETMDYFICVT
jgi:hypothetical protein